MNQVEKVIYIAPEGRDDWSGSLCSPAPDFGDGPLASVERAGQIVRSLDKSILAAVHVVIRGGTYYLDQPWRLSGLDSGTMDCPVFYEAWPGERPVISGGVAVSGWQETLRNGLRIWVAPAQGHVFHNLWANGERRLRPRFPKSGLLRTVGPSPGSFYEGTNEFMVGTENLRHFADQDAVEMVYFAVWTESRLPIRTIDWEKGIVHTGLRSAMNACDVACSSHYYYDNVFEELDTPGQWYLNRSENKLYYLPLEGETLDNTQIVAARLVHVLEVAGTRDNPVAHIHFTGLTFQHTEWWRTPESRIFRWDIRKLDPPSERDIGVVLLADDKAADHQAAISCEAALDFIWTRSCRITGCTISETGSYGIALGIGCTNNQISRCLISDHGGGGVKIGTQQFEVADAAGYNVISDCEIRDCAEVFHSAVGVWIGHSAYNQLIHNAIHDMSYSGISAGWVWGYGPSGAFNNLIEDNEIYNIAVNGWMHDLAGIYMLGVSPGTIVRHNYIHHVGKDNNVIGIYTDEGSSYIRWENNIVDRANAAYLHHFGRSNLIVNNIFAHYEHGLIRGKDETPEISFSVEHNIFMSDFQEIVLDWKGRTGYFFRNNLYWCKDGVTFNKENFEAWQALGHDEDSLVADPLFIDAEKSDFNLAADSPAFAIGFKPFPTTGYGPRGD
ncbi:MAG TPA: hypothetical protein DD640_05320 [Clostridiales bacterium]|nr:hypothetical protein [Clostridiales bacterium]